MLMKHEIMKSCNRTLILFLAIIFINNCTKITPKINKDKFVFLSNRESSKGNFDIFLSDLHDTNQINLTKDIQFIRSISKPILSPNKRHVLYTSFNKNQKSLHLIDIETKEDIYLSDLKMDKAYASFIENGDKILFTKKIEKVMQLFTIDVNGQNEKNISSTDNDEYKAQISSFNNILVFLRKVNKKTSIVIRDLRTKKEDSVEVNGNYINPSFNNDNKIIYESFTKGSYKIFIYDIKTKKIEQVTTGDANAHYPVFINDNQSLLFISDGRGKKFRDLCMLNLKTKKHTFLSSDLNMINQNFDLSVDKNNVIFESIQFGNAEIYLYEINSKGIVNLSKNSAWDCQPSF